MPRTRSDGREPYLVVHDVADVDRYIDALRSAAARSAEWITAFQGDPLDLLRQMKFTKVGRHPIDDRPLNLVEQINQTWTYAAALAAVRQLLKLHPDAGGFMVAPGAHMAIPLDIMSMDGTIGAETFAAVDPRNNRKLRQDLAKMAGRPELHRYVFFAAPGFPGTQRRHELEDGGAVQVWSVEI